MKRRSLLLAPLLAGCAQAHAAPETASGFAVVSPDAAAGLAGRSDAAARAVIRAADRAAARTPHAMARVHVEGTLPHQGIYDESAEALLDFPMARDLALAARITGQIRDAEAASRLIGAWSGYAPSFNPIDETGFDALFIAWDLLPAAQREPMAPAIGSLLRRFADGYLQHPLRGQQTSVNNWNSHRVKLIVLSAFALGDARLIERARDAYAAQLAANIRPDGHSIDFELRDAIHYVTYDLEPLALAAIAARAHGIDWWPLADGALPRAFGWLAPYAAGEKAHTEFEHTQVAFDITRRNAGLPGFGGPFDPQAAKLAMAYAARLAPRFAPISARLGDVPWLEVLFPLTAR